MNKELDDMIELIDSAYNALAGLFEAGRIDRSYRSLIHEDYVSFLRRVKGKIERNEDSLETEFGLALGNLAGDAFNALDRQAGRKLASRVYELVMSGDIKELEKIDI
jgi:hypothetical protein